jgi:SAM-dependent methyltransferase
LDLTEFPNGKEEATFEELAQTCGLNESEVKRLLRHAMAFRIFTEPRKGVVAHTAASKRLADPLMKAWIGMATEELWPCAVKTVETLQKWPEASEPTQTPFNMAHNTDRVFFDEIAKFPKREIRYADAMGWFNSGPGLEPTGLVDTIPWSDYETVVDVGGNTGLVSQAIARKHKSVNFIVQDRPEPVAEGKARLPDEFKDQITFMEHDFFNDQPLRADVYLMRWILHDWSDKYAIKILKALIPALKRGARIVLNELVPPPPGVGSPYGNKLLRTMDLTMLELHNGKERDDDDWRQLFNDCDPRFKYLGVTRPPGSRLAVVQAKWEP